MGTFGRATVFPPPSGFPWGQISSIQLLSPQARPVQCTGDFTAQQTVSAVVWVWERIWAGLSGMDTISPMSRGIIAEKAKTTEDTAVLAIRRITEPTEPTQPGRTDLGIRGTCSLPP
jgi:hypothetical protein